MDGNLIRFNTEDSQFRIFAPEDNQSYTSFALPAKTVSGSGVRTGLFI